MIGHQSAVDCKISSSVLNTCAVVGRNLLLVAKHRVWSVHQPSTVVPWLDINLLLITKSLHQSWTLVLWSDVTCCWLQNTGFGLFTSLQQLFCDWTSICCWLENLFISLEHLFRDWTSIYYWLDDPGCCLFISLEHLSCDWTSICCWLQDKHLISSTGLNDYVPLTVIKCECSVDWKTQSVVSSSVLNTCTVTGHQSTIDWMTQGVVSSSVLNTCTVIGHQSAVECKTSIWSLHQGCTIMSLQQRESVNVLLILKYNQTSLSSSVLNISSPLLQWLNTNENRSHLSLFVGIIHVYPL